MSEKLNHSDLSAMLAKEAGISVAKADTFTKALFDIVIEGLEQDGIVKINGLGTFKTTDVADRSSVNVNTGEKFEIKGHKKLTFVPAESLKECVNRPFAMFEPVEIDEDYQDENDNDAKIPVPVTDELNEPVAEPFNAAEFEEEMPCENESDKHDTVTAALLIEEEQVIEEDESVVGMSAGAEEESAVEEEEEIADEQKTVEKAVEDVQDVEDDDTEVPAVEMVGESNGTKETVEEVTEKEESKSSDIDVPLHTETATENMDEPNKRNLRFAISFIIGIIAGVGIVSMLSRNHTDDAVDGNKGTEFVSNRAVAVTRNEPVTAVEDSVSVAAVEETETPADSVQVVENTGTDDEYVFIMVDELVAKSDKEIADADTTLYAVDGDIATHVVAENERLAKIAYDYYGSRKLWPYIAKHNNLKEPYALAVGMELSIPKLQPKK